MAHPIVHIEITSADPAASSRFYADLFGWNISHDEGLSYYMYDAGGLGGGFPQADEHNPAGQVLMYVGTDNIEATLANAAKLGAQLVLPKTEIPGMGWMAIFRDPHGALVGLYTGQGQTQ